MHLLATADQQALGARLDPLDRPAELPAEQTYEDLLGEGVHLQPERPADVGEDDAHTFLFDAERLGDDHPLLVRILARRVERERVGAPIPVADVPARLDRLRRVAVDPELVGQSVRGGGESAVGVSLCVCDAHDQVGAPTVVDDRRVVGERGIGVDYRRQRLVLDLDQVEERVSVGARLGDECRHGLTRVHRFTERHAADVACVAADDARVAAVLHRLGDLCSFSAVDRGKTVI